jgi:hypothetical protein
MESYWDVIYLFRSSSNSILKIFSKHIEYTNENSYNIFQVLDMCNGKCRSASQLQIPKITSQEKVSSVGNLLWKAEWEHWEE